MSDPTSDSSGRTFAFLGNICGIRMQRSAVSDQADGCRPQRCMDEAKLPDAFSNKGRFDLATDRTYDRATGNPRSSRSLRLIPHDFRQTLTVRVEQLIKTCAPTPSATLDRRCCAFWSGLSIYHARISFPHAVKASCVAAVWRSPRAHSSKA